MLLPYFTFSEGSSWQWSYSSWIYNYLCNQCLSLMLLVRIPIRLRCTTLCDKFCQWFTTGRWFSPGPPVSSTNKTDSHDITKILLKVALNTVKPNRFPALKVIFPSMILVLSVICLRKLKGDNSGQIHDELMETKQCINAHWIDF